MHLVLVGLNHHSAPIGVREKLAFSEASLPNALRALRARPHIREAAILSTCNRTEVYALSDLDSPRGILVDFLSEYHRVPEQNYAAHLYVHRGREAASHLFSVASGLDSLVLGEPQILKQVRDAFAAAAGSGALGPVLNALFRAAIATGKRARTETDIGKGGFSVGHAAVDLARSIFGSLRDASVMILGAGKMSELTARHLVSNGIRIVVVANRTFDRASAMAERLGGEAITYDAFPDRLARTDIVISSTASPTHIVTRDTISPVLRKRRGRPLFLIDIAVPRDIAPDVAHLENVFLYDLDDLEAVVADMARERASETARVGEIVAEEAGAFLAWWRSLEAAPLVTQLKQKHEEIRQSELARLRNQLPDLPEAAWARIEAATRSMMNRVARDPVARLKAAAAVEEPGLGETVLQIAGEIFGLENGSPPEAAEKGAEAP